MRAPGAAVARVLAGALTLASAAGCADGGGAGAWEGSVRDSAGVVVVENRGPGLWRPGETWTVRPLLEVGGDESRPETLFGDVADAAIDGDGRLYVLDPTAGEVRVFGPDGAWSHAIGAPGEGPGELGRFANAVLLRGDTVVVPDWGQQRVNRYRPDGGFLRSDPLAAARGTRSWWKSGPDGTLYARSLARTVEDGRWRGEDLLLRVGAERADTVLRFRYPESDLGGPGAGNLRVPLVVNAPTWDVLDGGRVAWTHAEAERVRIVGPDGTLLRVVGRDAWTRDPASGPDGERMVALLGEKIGMLGGDPDVVEGLDVTLPERLPAVTAVRAGPDGTLWVQRMGGVEGIHPMALNGPDHPDWLGGATWDVLDPDGRYLGSVELPPRTRVMRIAADRILGVRRDDLDVERVVVLQLSR